MLKQRFRILLLPPQYPLDFQARIPAALCALHNSICQTDLDEGELPTDQSQRPYEPYTVGRNYSDSLIPEADDDSEFGKRRLNIANQMWESYQNYLVEHGAHTEEEVDHYLDE